MPTATHIYDYVAGSTLVMEFDVKSSAGAPVDLTGVTIHWGVAKRLSSTEVTAPVLTKVTGSGIDILDAVNGRVRVTVDAGDLSIPGEYVHQLNVTFPGSGDVFTQATGLLLARPSVFPNPV